MPRINHSASTQYSLLTGKWLTALSVLILSAVLTGRLLSQNRENLNDPEAIEVLPDKSTNPHWTSNGCDSCHLSEKPTSADLKNENIEQGCLACHNGHQAKAEIHTIKTLDSSINNIDIPADWPIIEGKLTCVTCHNIKSACNPEKKRPLINPQFLRDGRQNNSPKYCSNCHIPDNY